MHSNNIVPNGHNPLPPKYKSLFSPNTLPRQSIRCWTILVSKNKQTKTI